MINCKKMLENISKGQSSIPLRYILIGLENDYSELKNDIILNYIDRGIETTTIYYK